MAYLSDIRYLAVRDLDLHGCRKLYMLARETIRLMYGDSGVREWTRDITQKAEAKPYLFHSPDNGDKPFTRAQRYAYCSLGSHGQAQLLLDTWEKLTGAQDD